MCWHTQNGISPLASAGGATRRIHQSASFRTRLLKACYCPETGVAETDQKFGWQIQRRRWLPRLLLLLLARAEMPDHTLRSDNRSAKRLSQSSLECFSCCLRSPAGKVFGPLGGGGG